MKHNNLNGSERVVPSDDVLQAMILSRLLMIQTVQVHLQLEDSEQERLGIYVMLNVPIEGRVIMKQASVRVSRAFTVPIATVYRPYLN